MKNVTEIRRLKLKKLELEYGSQVVLAEVIELSTARVNHLLTGQRNIGEKAARKIELLIKKPIGWLDTLESDLQQTNHNGYLEQANLTPEQLALIKGMIAQFEKTNPAKSEHKALTSPAENVGGGGVKEPSVLYSVANTNVHLFDDYLLSIKQSCKDADCYREEHTNTENVPPLFKKYPPQLKHKK